MAKVIIRSVSAVQPDVVTAKDVIQYNNQATTTNDSQISVITSHVLSAGLLVMSFKRFRPRPQTVISNM